MQQGSSATATLTDEQILGLEPIPGTNAANGGGSASVAQVLPPSVRREPEDFFAGNASDDGTTQQPSVILSEAKDLNATVDGEILRRPPEKQRAPQNDIKGTDDPAWLATLAAQPQGGAEAAAQARAWRAAATDVAALDAAYFSTKP